VAVSAGGRTTDSPRLAVTGAIVLLFASLGLLLYFGNHLAHSIQVDAIMQVALGNTLEVIDDGLFPGSEGVPPVPDDAVPIPARRSGYVQAAYPDTLLAQAGQQRVCLRLRPRVGEHVVAGTTLAWVWPIEPDGPAADPRAFRYSPTTPALEPQAFTVFSSGAAMMRSDSARCARRYATAVRRWASSGRSRRDRSQRNWPS
jgi:hypothetical protein